MRSLCVVGPLSIRLAIEMPYQLIRYPSPIAIRCWLGLSIFVFLIAHAGCKPKVIAPASNPTEVPTDDIAIGTAITSKSSEGSPSQPSVNSASEANTARRDVISAPDSSWQESPAPTDALRLRNESKLLADELVANLPDNPDAYEVKARFHLLFGESEQAAESWRVALRLVPNYPYAIHGLGKAEMLNSNFEAAIGHFKQASSLQPTNAEPVHDLADAYTKLGQIEESIATLKVFVEKFPQSVDTRVLLGQSYLVNGEFTLAEPEFRSALQLSPGLARAEQGLGTALLRLGKREQAEQYLVTQLARRSLEKVDLSAQQSFRDSLRECAIRFCSAAEVYIGAKNFTDAERVVRRSLVLQPNYGRASGLLVSILRNQRQFDEALLIAREQCSSDSTNPSWHFTYGVLLAETGKHATAQEQFREVIRLAPESPIGYESLARSLINSQSSLKETISIVSKLVKVRGSAADHELLGQAFAVNADFPNAFRSLSEAIRLDPANRNYQAAMQHLKRAMGPQP